MSTLHDEDFARELRAHVETIAPEISVDTEHVLPRARRRRARRAVVTGVATVGAVVLAAGWVTTAQPWAPVDLQPAGPTVPLEARATAGPDDEPDVTEGWPGADFWYVKAETVAITPDGKKTTTPQEAWYGHSDPGILIRDGDLEDPIAFGPRIWGVLLIDGNWTQISWDQLYTLPTDPAGLEVILRHSVEPDGGTGTPDDKVFAMALDLLSESPAPPSLRDAIWQVMAGLPASTVEQGAADSRSRPGVRLDYAATGAVNPVSLVYDPEEHRLLEKTELWVGTAEGGSPTTTYLEEGTADAPPIEPTLEMAGCGSWETC